MWAIEQKLAEDVANPIISHNIANTCWQPHVKGQVQQQNSIYNNWRFESVWRDQRGRHPKATSVDFDV